MKIHHLNCGTFCPSCQRLLEGKGSWLQPATMCCHCLAIETSEGLILVDTGLGVQDVLTPKHLGHTFRNLMRPKLELEETALFQLDQMGFNRREVRHIVLTHLDLDHAGGIADFPAAKIHACSTEIEAALRPHWRDKLRYRAKQFEFNPKWAATINTTDTWFGFENIQRLKGIKEEIILVPLHGHTRGHCGVAVKQSSGKWLFHVGDLYMDRRSLYGKAPAAMKQCENLLAVDNKQRLGYVKRVRQLIDEHSDAVEVFCAHDMSELNYYREQQLD
ncbi:MBL fold metallo-hydrolase [Alkanindiges illinoisensis]|uniref:MBL fold metallo-hydrolase n=1 Tax=Alkanindiges illinoisensis TaxID=197183 RepID=UPI00054FD82C|nr:MBL fold metallo-hydrolase [Alkanindiges illinoisensis]